MRREKSAALLLLLLLLVSRACAQVRVPVSVVGGIERIRARAASIVPRVGESRQSRRRESARVQCSERERARERVFSSPGDRERERERSVSCTVRRDSLLLLLPQLWCVFVRRSVSLYIYTLSISRAYIYIRAHSRVYVLF